MKPYFAKYLPVEGEIKEGDKVLFEGNILTVNEFTHDDTICFKEETEQEIPEQAFLRTAQKVKLFLCSRDIKVGDAVINPDTLLDEIYSEEDRKYYSSFGGKSPYFKIIGEISPDATWVKEDDEFLGTEVKFFYKSEDNYHFLPYDSHHKLLIDANLKVKKGQLIVEIKGPCNHFH